MDIEFKDGDVVQLKSGGPKMTVTTVGEHWGETKVWCMWFDGTKRFEEVFKPAALRKAAP